MIASATSLIDAEAAFEDLQGKELLEEWSNINVFRKLYARQQELVKLDKRFNNGFAYMVMGVGKRLRYVQTHSVPLTSSAVAV